jgi:hypothetical protein
MRIQKLFRKFGPNGNNLKSDPQAPAFDQRRGINLRSGLVIELPDSDIVRQGLAGDLVGGNPTCLPPLKGIIPDNGVRSSSGNPRGQA